MRRAVATISRSTRAYLRLCTQTHDRWQNNVKIGDTVGARKYRVGGKRPVTSVMQVCMSLCFVGKVRVGRA